MTPDYDLSNLESAQVNLWLYLHIDDICAQITAGRASRRVIVVPPREGELREESVRSTVFTEAESRNR